MTFFNFDCYAVLSIDTYNNDPQGEPDTPELCGFWLTQAEAQNAIDAMKAKRRSDWEASRDQYPHLWRTTYEADQSPIFYAIVPLTQLAAKNFWDIEGQLEAAAKLQYQGIGKLPKAFMPELSTQL